MTDSSISAICIKQLYRSYLLANSHRLYFLGPLGNVNKRLSSVLNQVPPPPLLGIVLGYERKSCCNTGQVCHFLTVPHVFLHKCYNTQEMLTHDALANIQGSSSRQPLPIQYRWLRQHVMIHNAYVYVFQTCPEPL